MAHPFLVTRLGIEFELRMVEPTSLTVEVVMGALQVLYHYVQTYGARDVKPLIRCEGKPCGQFNITFVGSGQGHALINIPSNATSASLGLSA